MCKVNWCNNKNCISGNGYCRKHYDEIRKYGTITDNRPRGKRNNYINNGEYSILQILNDKGNVIIESLVDTEDVDRLKKYSFRYENNRYIKTMYKGKTYYLHRLIMNYNGDLEIDHINRNKLDNRKCNLRVVDRIINANNITLKDTYGIIKTNRKLDKPYMLKIKNKFIGYYKTFDEAKDVRNRYITI